MLTKTELINSLESLPENLTVDEIIDHIFFVEKVQKGLEDSEKGQISTKQEAKKILDKWLK
jgi:predicted transcriptional regulator